MRAKLPGFFARLSANQWQKIVMSLMMTGSWIVYALIPKPVTLVLVMGAIDAPLIGVLMITYAFLGRRYLPQAYRSGAFWCVPWS